jgi:NADPH:quinone reductase-like Zn-dependent oxidoreductase
MMDVGGTHHWFSRLGVEDKTYRANLSFEQAAVVPISGFAALQGLRDEGQVQPGQQVLIRALTPKGTLVIVGGEGGGRWLGGIDRNLRAVALSRLVGQRLRMLSSKPGQADLEVLRELLEAGTLTPVIGRTFHSATFPRRSGRWSRATDTGQDRHHRVRP